MEEKVTAGLTERERESLLSALGKIHRTASELMGRESGEAGAVGG